MIVLDASAVVEFVLGTSGFDVVADRLASDPDGAHAPHLIDVEVLHALRRLTMSGELSRGEATDAIEIFRGLDIERYSHVALVDCAWDLRANHSAYDAVYLALTEALDATLLTADARLRTAKLRRGRVEVTV